MLFNAPFDDFDRGDYYVKVRGDFVGDINTMLKY